MGNAKKFVSILVIILGSFFLGVMFGKGLYGEHSSDKYIAKSLEHYEGNYLYSLYLNAGEEFKNKNYNEAKNLLRRRDIILENITDGRDKESNSYLCVAKIADLSDKIAKTPNDYKLYYERANLFNTSNDFSDEDYSFCSDYKSAMEDYSKVIELNPKHKEVYEKRMHATGMSMNGVSYSKSEEKYYKNLFDENHKQMLSDIQKSIELNGESEDRVTLLASAYCMNEQSQKGIETCSKIKDNAVRNFGLGICYLVANEPEQTLKQLVEFRNSIHECNDKCSESSLKLYYHIKSKAECKSHRYFACVKDTIKLYSPTKDEEVKEFCHCGSEK